MNLCLCFCCSTVVFIVFVAVIFIVVVVHLLLYRTPSATAVSQQTHVNENDWDMHIFFFRKRVLDFLQKKDTPKKTHSLTSPPTPPVLPHLPSFFFFFFFFIGWSIYFDCLKMSQYKQVDVVPSAKVCAGVVVFLCFVRFCSTITLPFCLYVRAFLLCFVLCFVM